MMKKYKSLRNILSGMFYLILVGILVFASISIFSSRWTNRSSVILTLKATKIPEKVVILPTTSVALSTSLTQTLLPSPSTSTQLVSSTPTVQPTSTPSSAPTPTLYPTTTWKPSQKNIVTDVPDDWLTYVDEEAGFSFKYPPDVNITSGLDVDNKYKHVSISLLPSNVSNPYVVVIVKDNPDNMTLQYYLTQRYVDFTKQVDAPPEYLAAMEEMEINDFPAVWNKTDSASEVFVVLSAENKIFNFLLVNAIMVDDMRVTDDAAKDTFFKILNTFATISQ